MSRKKLEQFIRRNKFMRGLQGMAFSFSLAAAVSFSVTAISNQGNIFAAILPGETEENTVKASTEIISTVTADLSEYEGTILASSTMQEVIQDTEESIDEDDEVQKIACDKDALAEIEKQEAALPKEDAPIINTMGGTTSVVTAQTYTVYSTNEETLWNFFKGLGFTDEGAAAALGNLSVESGLNPASHTKNFDPENETGGGGLAGWMCYGRFRSLLAYANTQGQSWSDLNIQMDYLAYELSHNRKNVGDEMKTVTDLDYASDYFCVYFEGCIGQTGSGNDAISTITGEWYQGLALRKERAQAYYERYSS